MTAVTIGTQRLRIEDIIALAQRTQEARLSPDADFRARINRGAEFVDRLIAEDVVVYGLSPGYGDSCPVAIPLELSPDLHHHL